MRLSPVGQPRSFKEIHQRRLCGAVEAVTGEIHNWVAIGYTIVVTPQHSLYVTLLSMLLNDKVTSLLPHWRISLFLFCV